MRKCLFFLTLLIVCINSTASEKYFSLRLGADKLTEIFSLVKNKRVALVVNQTSCLSNGTFLVDTLLSSGVQIQKLFAPEHGFRGNVDAGEKIATGRDVKTGLQIISLYGKNYKPYASQLKDVDLVVYDIQDVGARFYTYISTLYYVMEACAENNVEVLVLDRPNPNDVVDGPVLNLNYRSFVGMLPIPVLYGMTVAELATMINGEGWLKGHLHCNLKTVLMSGWKHGQLYSLPVKPSPNLPNDQSIRLYPSLCFFEATNVSVGRGTAFPFQVLGYPNKKFGNFRFTPQAMSGAKYPIQKGNVCYGVDLRKQQQSVGINLDWLLHFYKISGLGAKFFSSPSFMNKLSGTNQLRLQIIQGKTAEEIRQSWQSSLERFNILRKRYLLYKL